MSLRDMRSETFSTGIESELEIAGVNGFNPGP